MRVYIAGPISNEPDYIKKFEKAKRQIKLMLPDCEVINPAKLSEVLPKGKHYEYLQICYKLIAIADAVVLLPNWDSSIGAIKERLFAKTKNIPVFELSNLKALRNYVRTQKKKGLNMNIKHEFTDRSNSDAKYVIIDMNINNIYKAIASIYICDSDEICESELKIEGTNCSLHLKHDGYSKAKGMIMKCTKGAKVPIDTVKVFIETAVKVLEETNNKTLTPLVKELI
jgi:hypothetical protein